jgi:hypothetical protein
MTALVRAVTGAILRLACVQRLCGERYGSCLYHGDAVHRAGGQAQFAAGTIRGHHGVQVFACADNGVHRARWQTLGAANTNALINDGNAGWAFPTVARVDGLVRSA